ncbi:MAG: protein kinase, partial [Thermoanaerobaculia bacterium]
MSGRMLGHYEVLEKLGEGGMGVVYRAFDTQLRREVAIKVLPERSQRDQQRLLRFEREALLLASLNHPNIVSIYSVERNDDGPFIVMEVIDGKPLSKVIPQDGMEVKRFLK